MNKSTLSEITTSIEKLSHDGRGIARIDGKATFIEGALPEEIVTFRYRRKKKDYDEGELISVLKASPERAAPQCPHYTDCGGCSLQHIRVESQILLKQSQLLDLLKRIGHSEPQYTLPPLTADVWHYRHKARLSVRYVEKKQKVLIGFREKKNPRYIAEMTQCHILSAKFEPLLRELPLLIESLNAHQMIAQIEVAVGDTVALIFRNMVTLDDQDKIRLKTFGQQFDLRIFLQPAGPDSVSLLYPEDASVYLTYALPEQDISFQFYPTDFTQINPSINRLMVNRALSLLNLSSHDVVLDLFCGLGNFSLPLAKNCARVIGVEGSEAMVQRARMNATANQIINAEFQCVNLEDESVYSQFKSFKANKILIDPPRAGALAFVKNIALLNPELCVYISCDPATLARDTAILVHEKGYTLVCAGVMDMFPHTAHVESIALFQKKKDV